jgi:uracil-DNA glycosylase family 4
VSRLPWGLRCPSSMEDCDRCSQLVVSRSRIVPGAGSSVSRALFVGLAPGRNGADVTGIPFTRDPSGRLFREMLGRVGLFDAFVTNLVKCNPKDEKGRNRNPTREEIDNCRPHLDAELEKVGPRVVVLLGNIVTKEFMPDTGRIVQEHGQARESDGTTYVPFIHPSYVIRGAYPREKYASDFANLAALVAMSA